MLWFKRCPRCGGDLAEEADRFGRYIACVQCAHELSAVEEAVLRHGGVGSEAGSAVESEGGSLAAR